MIRRFLLLLSLIMIISCLSGFAQKAALKSNLLYDATTTLNLGLEFRTGRKTTLELPVNYNPWTFSDNKKFKHILVQPEFRFWNCEPFNRGFWGIHAHYSYFNVGGIDLPFGVWNKLENNRYQGWLAGAGISYGYQWYLGRRWNLEATIGAGYAYIDYEQYKCGNCGVHIKDSHKHYVGPTKIGLSLVYLFNDGKGKSRKQFGPNTLHRK